MDSKKQRKIEKLANLLDRGDVAVLEHLLEIEENFETLTTDLKQEFGETVKEIKASVPDLNKVLETIKAKDGYTPEKGVDYFDGENYILTNKDKKDIAKEIEVPIVEKIIEKRTEVVVREQPIVTNEVVEVAVFDREMMEREVPGMGERIRDGLELLPEGEKLRQSAIEGLEEALKDLYSKAGRTVGGIARGFQLYVGSVKKGLVSAVDIKAGTNVTVTHSQVNGLDTVTIASTGSGAGITRSISSVAINTTAGAAASTDYVYLVSGTTTLTLPTAVGNTNRYTLIHTDSLTMTIATTGGQTIAFYPPAPATTATVSVIGTVVELFSDNSNWWTV